MHSCKRNPQGCSPRLVWPFLDSSGILLLPALWLPSLVWSSASWCKMRSGAPTITSISQTTRRKKGQERLNSFLSEGDILQVPQILQVTYQHPELGLVMTLNGRETSKLCFYLVFNVFPLLKKDNL